MAGLDDVLKIRESKLVPVGLLKFDTNNPRFTLDKLPTSDTDEAVIEKLASTADLGELVQSIATSGYINIEPLIVRADGERFKVLEGNRRLAAVKVLRNPDLAKAARLTLPPIEADKLLTLDNILCYRVAADSDARDLIGFKHINGPQAWDAFAKAKFAATWLADEQARAADGGTGLTLAEIARRMGDQHTTIHRMVSAYLVLQQAEQSDVFHVDDRQRKSFAFSHLYTGLSYDEYTSFLGMPRPDRSEDPPKAPVPEGKLKDLGSLLIWLYGSKSRGVPPVVQSQNPDLGQLRKVLASPAAIKVLAERNSLEEAVVTATPATLRFEQHLIAANGELQHAVATLDGFDAVLQPELQQIADAMLKRAQLIKSQIDIQVTSTLRKPN